MGTDLWAAGLDPEQRQAVEHDGAALLIVAGAGTGKTRTLVARLARLIELGTAPERLLLVTFSRRAADEMIRRLAPLVGAATARQVHAGTFHAIAHRLLAVHAPVLGLEAGFSVLDQGDAVDLMHLARFEAMRGLGEGEERRRFPRKDTLLSVYSRVVNSRRPLRAVLRQAYPWVQEHEAAIASTFSIYCERKRAQHLLDFDDLLLYWRAAAVDPDVGPVLAGAYDHVLVDEYQDTNLLQAEIVRALRAGVRPVTAVGDDAQAIYGFRAATVANMLEFPDHFPGAAVVTLERNYRSTQPILDLANAVLADATEGYRKRLRALDRDGGGRPVLATCPDEAAQADAVADVVLEHHEAGVALRDQAVLFRAAHHSDLLEVELRRRGIPYVKYGGLRFLEAAHVRDLLAALRVLDNPRDELAWTRLLQLMDGVGPAGAHRALVGLGVVDGGVGVGGVGVGGVGGGGVGDGGGVGGGGVEVGEVGGVGVGGGGGVGVGGVGGGDGGVGGGGGVGVGGVGGGGGSGGGVGVAGGPLARFVEGPGSSGWPLPARALDDHAALAAALGDCRDDALAPGAQIDRLRAGLDPLLRRRYDNAEVRLRDLEALARLATAFETRGQMVTELTLDPPASTGDLAGPPLLDDDYLILSTVHSAKGGEWRVVHLIHAADGMFPSDMATGSREEIEEERRLFYVALTRAREHLHIYAPLRYHHGGSFRRGDAHSYAQRTRFLPPAVDGLLDHRAVRARRHDVALPPVAVPLPAAVDEVLRGLW